MTRNRESGYALLFVYAMAAILAIMLFLELPRAAFEAQRDREQLLVDRGEQYSRAVALYVRKFNTYPPSIEALDSSQNLRFLRNHYVDPMTGKDEWRLIHVGPGGVFTDSLVYGKKKDDKKSEPQNFITELAPAGGNQDAQTAVNLAARQRPSDQAGAPGDPNNPQPNLPPPQPVNTPQPGLTAFGTPQVDVNGQPVAINPLQQGGFSGQTPPGQTPFYGNGLPTGAQQQPGIVPPSPFQTGQATNSMPSPAGTNLINQLLTSPRPGGAPPGIGGMPQTGQPSIDQFGNPVPANPLTGTPNATPGVALAAPAPAAAGPQIVGGGIAGVASKREQEGIKLYKEKKKYNEWEFVYDINKDPTRTGVPPGAVPNAGNGLTASAGAAQQPQTQQNLQQVQQQMQLFNQQQIQQQQQQQFPQQNAPAPPPFSPGLPPPGIPPTGPGMAPPPQSQ